METISRRNFVKFSAASAAGIMLSPTLGFSSAPTRLFKISLNPFAVGVNLGQEELIDKALKYGFEAILPIPAQLAEMQTGQRSEFLAKMNARSEEHTSELQSRPHLVCRLLLEKKKKKKTQYQINQ